MSENRPDVGDELLAVHAEILAIRGRLAKVVEEFSERCEGSPILDKFEAVCEQLDWIAAEMRWAVEAGLTRKVPDGDPIARRQIQRAQRQLIDVAVENLGVLIRELRAEAQAKAGPVN